MGTYQRNRRARLLAKKTAIEAALDALDVAYLAAVENAEVESYKFDSGEGSQQTKRRNLSEIRKESDALEADLSHVINELAGVGILNVQLRRKRETNGNKTNF